jgi:hypothetical protein
MPLFLSKIAVPNTSMNAASQEKLRLMAIPRILLIVGLVFLLTVQWAMAQTVPLPPQRPPSLTSNTPQSNTERAQSDCGTQLAALGLLTEVPPKQVSDNAACKIDDAIRLTSMTFKGRTVGFPDRPILDCKAATAVGLWLRDMALPLTEATLGSPVAAMGTGPGFECRNRNRAKTGKLSAHANGLAIDMAMIRLVDNRTLVVEQPNGEAQKQLLDALRRSACGWFTTVLGPGSDAAHADHLHLDVEPRGISGTSRFCQ